MAKTKNQSRDTRTAEIASGLPEGESELLEQARQAVLMLNTAVLSADSAGADTAAQLYDAVRYKLNGNTFRACSVGNPSVTQRIEAYCAAEPGTVPMWGQCGEFLLDMGTYRLWVTCNMTFGMQMPHMEFHAVDLNRPFLSESGYRSNFISFVGRNTVDEAARAIAATMAPRKITDEGRNSCAKRQLPEWLQAVTPSPFRKPAQAAQTAVEGFEKVDVLLPPYQAYIARKWAKEAQMDLFGKE